MDRRSISAIAIGAIFGAGLRWLTTRWSGVGGEDLALLVLNVAGSTLLAYTASRLVSTGTDTIGTERGASTAAGALITRRELSAFWGAGFCGALTTWSSLAVRTAEQLRLGPVLAPTLWLGANLALGACGALLARRPGTTHPAPEAAR